MTKETLPCREPFPEVAGGGGSQGGRGMAVGLRPGYRQEPCESWACALSNGTPPGGSLGRRVTRLPGTLLGIFWGVCTSAHSTSSVHVSGSRQPSSSLFKFSTLFLLA